jgi:hypothetical protein
MGTQSRFISACGACGGCLGGVVDCDHSIIDTAVVCFMSTPVITNCGYILRASVISVCLIGMTLQNMGDIEGMDIGGGGCSMIRRRCDRSSPRTRPIATRLLASGRFGREDVGGVLQSRSGW